MDYKNVLTNHLLSQTNIDFIIKNILSNFKIKNNENTINKCINIITNNFGKYLENLNRYPENNNELIEAVNFLNKKCYDDFTIYLYTKYPHLRTSVSTNQVQNSDMNNSSQQNIHNHSNSALELSNNTQINGIPNQSESNALPINYPQISMQSAFFPMNRLSSSPETDSVQFENRNNQIVKNLNKISDKKNFKDPNETMVIIDEEEKDAILKKYNTTPHTTTKSDEFLSYLTNPMVLQMFSTMINQMNSKKDNEIQFDKILDAEQVQVLLMNKNKSQNISETNKISVPTNTLSSPKKIKQNSTKQINDALSSKKNNKKKNNKEKNNIVTKSNNIDTIFNTVIPKSNFTTANTNLNNIKKNTDNYVDDSNNSDDEDNENNEYDNENDENDENDETCSDDIDETTETNKKIVFNLNKMSKEMLPLIDKRAKEIVELKNKYASEGNKKMIEKLDKEKNEIIEAALKFKKEFQKQHKDSEGKINGLTMSRRKKDNEDDNIEYLDLKFDPTNDFNDLKNISIGFKSNGRIRDITLVDYYLPYNNNNVTRFNNKFVVYFNGKINRIVIPPGKYEIDMLLAYIKNYANFLEFSISENNVISVKNTMGLKFDLMNDKDTIFPLLGFIEKSEVYKDETEYTGSQPYNVNGNDKIYFSMSGSAMDPINLEFNQEIILNKSLKYSRAGVIIPKMSLYLVDCNEQYYDFILPFKMCFKITYAE